MSLLSVHGFTLPTSDSIYDFALPIDAYTLSASDFGYIALARDLLVGRCMASRGFDFEVDMAVALVKGSVEAQIDDVGQYGNARRYGVTAPDIATRYGYHFPSKTTSNPEKAPLWGGLIAPSTAELNVLDGVGLGDSSPKIPAGGGCQYVAENEFAAAMNGVVRRSTGAQADMVAEISRSSYDRSLRAPSVSAAFAKWGACMAALGYDDVTPTTVAGRADLTKTEPSHAEVAIAVADVKCKKHSELTREWLGFERRVQDRLIAQSRKQLELIKRANDREVAVARRVIEGGR